VIEALGFGPNRAHSALRISVGRFNTDEQIETAVDKIITAAQKLRAI
jgi:cysteine sulfinate desulfinase/cysteine desulfurase-like protein